MLKCMISSKTDMWCTPQWLFNELNEEFHFNLDVCATKDNAKCANFFTPEIDGLSQEWHGVCFMNPPYGKEISKWIKKAYESSLKGATVVCLLPARTDTRYFHQYCIKGEIRFIKGRLKFSDSINSAPFPSMIVIFRTKNIKTDCEVDLKCA
ncbi:MAG: phage N-6-adenine-methyltransferase [Oscillospiraceae bacterium]|nr:phage N-6-adenine-methyltransferase [Oscillospiraceae bacterium]